MPRHTFDALAQTLLRGGIAPRHVRRYINELSDHYDDLLDAARRSGQSPQDAERHALAQLGTPEDLAKAMLSRDDLKTLSARYPKSFFGAGPLLTLIVSLLGTGFLLVAVALLGQAMFGAKTSADLTPEQLVSMQQLQPMFDALAWAAKFILPVALGWLFLRHAIQQHAELRWVVVGVVAIAVVGGGADVAALLPAAPGVKGELKFGFGFAPPFMNSESSLVRAVINFILLAPGLWRLAQLRKSVLAEG
jgi:hypothetical protein